MSATRDKSQKIAFVYSNLYSIYRKGLEKAREGATQESDQAARSQAAQALVEMATGRPAASSFESGVVIKAKDVNVSPAARPVPPPAPPKVTTYTPAELIGKRVPRPASLPSAPVPATGVPKPVTPAVAELKKNLESLNDLQARLRFMLQELEDLIKD